MRVRGLAAVLLLLLGSSASAQMNVTGEKIKTQCRMALLASDTGNVAASGFGGGLCIGMLSTAMNFASYMVPEPMRICPPKDVTPNRANVVFLKFLDDHPLRLEELSLILAIDSFRAEWRCQNQNEPLRKSN